MILLPTILLIRCSIRIVLLLYTCPMVCLQSKFHIVPVVCVLSILKGKTKDEWAFVFIQSLNSM